MRKTTECGTPAAEAPKWVRDEEAKSTLGKRVPSGPDGISSVLRTSYKDNVVKGAKKTIVSSGGVAAKGLAPTWFACDTSAMMGEELETMSVHVAEGRRGRTNHF